MEVDGQFIKNGFTSTHFKITKENLPNKNMAFFKAKDISDEDKKKMIESIQEFYYKEKLKNEKQ